MRISIADPVLQTFIFAVFLLSALIFSIRPRKNPGSLPAETTLELKGFAVLAILFAHVGYFLASDTRFLFPLSVLAGASVDLFLFLSGFGLTMSALAKPLSPLQFYRKRLAKLYIPLWIALAAFFLLDFFLLGKAYGLSYYLLSFAGIFPTADIFADVSSPLWYFTLILGYYLLFPLVFSRERPYLSAAALYAVGLGITLWDPWQHWHSFALYQVHFMAFSLGMLAAWWAEGRQALIKVPPFVSSVLVGALAATTLFFGIHSLVGMNHWLEELGSVGTAMLVLAFFIVKPFEMRLLSFFGLVSFEIYLLHWPILYRYDVLFAHLPAWLAMIAYLFVFAGLGLALHYGAKRISARLL